MMTQLEGIVPKGWGYENIWVTNRDYCGKIMVFNGGAKFSMHFHAHKKESWYVLEGEFIVEWIDTKDSKIYSDKLIVGSTWTNTPLMPHRLICVIPGKILEVSTPDSVEDNYRVMPGDSQK